jgi:hypothetical protein
MSTSFPPFSKFKTRNFDDKNLKAKIQVRKAYFKSSFNSSQWRIILKFEVKHEATKSNFHDDPAIFFHFQNPRGTPKTLYLSKIYLTS